MSQASEQAAAPPKSTPVGFEQMRLRGGEMLQLTPQDSGGPAQHYTAQYIGALRGRGFITTLPLVEGKGLWMPDGNTFVVRVLAGTHVYAFTTRVVRARATPYPHVHFVYPDEVQARRVRKSRRVNMDLEVEVGAGRRARLLDLSMHGARVEVTAPLEGDEVELILPIKLDEVDSQLRIKASVRSRAETGEKGGEERDAAGKPEAAEAAGQGEPGADGGQPRSVGLEFGELPQQDALLLHYFIDHALVEIGPEGR